MGDVFKALSDSTRRKILELLQDQSLNAGEIADYFQITKPVRNILLPRTSAYYKDVNLI